MNNNDSKKIAILMVLTIICTAFITMTVMDMNRSDTSSTNQSSTSIIENNPITQAWEREKRITKQIEENKKYMEEIEKNRVSYEERTQKLMEDRARRIKELEAKYEGF